MEKITKALEISVIAGVPCTLTPEQCAEIIARIAELESKQRWISVKERLPDTIADVLVLSRGEPLIGSYHRVFWYIPSVYNSKVTHWMPLPNPPEVNNG